METAKKCAIHYNIEAVTVEELLKDKEIEIILNLTIPRAHFEVSKKTLENGKHSYAEKTMSVNFKDGKENGRWTYYLEDGSVETSYDIKGNFLSRINVDE